MKECGCKNSAQGKCACCLSTLYWFINSQKVRVCLRLFCRQTKETQYTSELKSTLDFIWNIASFYINKRTISSSERLFFVPSSWKALCHNNSNLNNYINISNTNVITEYWVHFFRPVLEFMPGPIYLYVHGNQILTN